MKGVLDYIELPVRSVTRQQEFYGKAFGWLFTEYGPEYAAYEDGPCQLGLNGVSDDHRSEKVLPVIRVDAIQDARAAVLAAGGEITLDVFAFPGGQRFHFKDPEGLELAAYQPEQN